MEVLCGKGKVAGDRMEGAFGEERQYVAKAVDGDEHPLRTCWGCEFPPQQNAHGFDLVACWMHVCSAKTKECAAFATAIATGSSR